MSAGLPLPIHVVGPLSCDFIPWRYRGVLSLTLVAKATFSLEDGLDATPIAPDKVQRTDKRWGDDPRASLCLASDLAPYLPVAGAVLTGHAWSAEPAAAVTVQFAVVGDAPLFDKAIHVFGDVPLR